MLQSTQSGSERAFDFMAKYGIHGVIGSGSAEGGAVERTCSASSSRLAPHSAAGPRRRGASHRRSSARPNDCFDQRQGRAPGGRTGRTSWRGGGIGGREGGGGWASAPRIEKPTKSSVAAKILPQSSIAMPFCSSGCRPRGTLRLGHRRPHAGHRIAETKHARGKGVVVLCLDRPLSVGRADRA